MKKYLGVLFAVLLTVACLVVPASAAEVYPSVDTGRSNYIVAWVNDNKYELFCFDDVTPLYSFAYSEHGLTFENTTTSSQTVYYYVLSDGVWTYSSSYSIAPNSRYLYSSGEPYEICESTCNIYDYDTRELFFQPPLPVTWEVQTLEAVTGQAPALVTAKLKTTLDCLVPLGIGLMALFVGLLLLRKVFYRFRVKS